MVNANIGTSGDSSDLSVELEKLRVAVKAGADAVMDLSTGGSLDDIRKEIIKQSPVTIGTVPIYSAVVELNQKGKTFIDMTSDDLFKAIEKHAEDGVDFITVHCGVTRSFIARASLLGPGPICHRKIPWVSPYNLRHRRCHCSPGRGRLPLLCHSV